MFLLAGYIEARSMIGTWISEGSSYVLRKLFTVYVLYIGGSLMGINHRNLSLGYHGDSLNHPAVQFLRRTIIDVIAYEWIISATMVNVYPVLSSASVTISPSALDDQQPLLYVSYVWRLQGIECSV